MKGLKFFFVPGEFKFDLNLGEVKLPERATYNIDEYKKALMEFTTVDNIMKEPEPDVKVNCEKYYIN